MRNTMHRADRLESFEKWHPNYQFRPGHPAKLFFPISFHRRHWFESLSISLSLSLSRKLLAGKTEIMEDSNCDRSRGVYPQVSKSELGLFGERKSFADGYSSWAASSRLVFLLRSSGLPPIRTLTLVSITDFFYVR